MKNLVTVYIVNSNYGKYISQAIQSVLNQTYKNIEILVIDDFSSDNSKKIIKKYVSNPKIKIILNKKKIGLLKSSNIAIKASKGEYVIRLDADDYFDKDLVSTFVKKIKNNLNSAFVYSDYYEVNKYSQIIKKIKQINVSSGSVIKDRPILAACCLIRKSLLINVGLYDETFTRQDGYDFWYKIINEYSFSYVPKALFFYRRHSKNLTKNLIKLFKTRSEILKKFASKEKSLSKNSLIIPVRGYELDKKNYLKKIKNRPILFYTIDVALKVRNIDKIILSCTDPKLLKICKNHERKTDEALLNQNFRVSLLSALKKFKLKPDNLVILTPEYPKKKAFYIEQALNKMNLHNLDKVISTTYDVDHNFYQYTKNGIKLISNDNQKLLKYEKKLILKETGGIVIFNLNSLKKNSIKKISNIIIDENSAFKI